VKVTDASREDLKLVVSSHREMLHQESASGRVSCGLLVSLRCRIPNLRPIEISSASGAHVLYFSKDFTDEMSELTMVTTAMRVVAQMAPLLCVKDGQTSLQTSSASPRCLEDLDRQIQATGKLQKDLILLREGLSKGGSSNSTEPSKEASQEDSLNKLPLLLQPEAKQLTLLVLEYKASKRRNPSSYGVLKIEDEGLLSYLNRLEEENIDISLFIAEAKKLDKSEKALKGGSLEASEAIPTAEEIPEVRDVTDHPSEGKGKKRAGKAHEVASTGSAAPSGEEASPEGSRKKLRKPKLESSELLQPSVESS
jgi:hypothetical protein